MAHKHQYLVYYIHLTDKALYDAKAYTGSPDTIGAVLAAPDKLAVEFGIPKLAKTAPFVAPCITSEWFGTEDHFPTNVDAFDRCSGGWFGICFLFGESITYHWRGIYTYSPPVVPAGVSVPQNISLRRWIDGFEIMEAQSSNVGPEGGLGNAGGNITRIASRHVDGMGWAMRSEGNITRRHVPNESTGGVNPSSMWERIYIRLRTLPDVQTRIWESRFNGALTGYVIEVMPSGQLSVGWNNSSGTFTQMGTTVAQPLETWRKLDIIHFGQAGIGHPDFEVLINGVSAINFSFGVGIAPVRGLCTESRLGSTGANTLGIDFDDWIGCDFIGTTDGVDMQNGSRVVLVRATGFDASMAGWAGDWRWCLLNPLVNADTSLLSSSTNGAVLAVTTDCGDVVDALPESLGAVAVMAHAQLTGNTVADTLSAASASVLLSPTGPVSTVATAWKGRFAALAGTPTPVRVLAPMVLKYVKTDVTPQTMRHLSATVELIGSFGVEDLGPWAPLPSVLPAYTGQHNAPYPRSPWARLTTPPIQPVFIRQGSYTGNGTAQDLLFPAPIHFLFIRPASGGNGGTRWWSTMIASHKNMLDGILSNLMPQALWDSSFVPAGVDTQQTQYKIRLVGANTNNNANTIGYQYLAIGDPGQRFLHCGGLRSSQGTVDVITNLFHTTFTALAGFFQIENPSSINNNQYYKGPGHAIANINPIGFAAEIAAAIQFGPGIVTSKSAFHTIGGQGPTCPFALFRADDGSSDDAGSNRGKVARLNTYVGDGAASRSVGLTPPVGKRPLWAMIVPHNGTQAYFKDAGHTALGVTLATTGAIATGGITGAGVDTISVDLTLNANGVVYEILEFPGSATAGSGGFSTPGDFWPVPPDPPPLAPGPPDGPEPGSDPPVDTVPPVVVPDPLPPTGPMPGLTDDLAAACEPATREMCNIALTRIGISKQIANVATDQTAEAVQVRLLYGNAMQQTLRDFAWPFATRYVKLTQASVLRPNSDWLYAYRQPNDCIFERRIVVSRTDAADAAPIPFACSSDYSPGDPVGPPIVAPSGGGLIFTNLANAVLEYTARPKCPHTVGEPLFREAAAWKLAELIAPALSRLTDAVVNCAKGYADAIGKAQLVIRPGNAGELPAASTLDTTAAQLAANVAVINLALVRIGANMIRNLTSDQSREAQIARTVFEQELRATLRDFPWSFATSYVTPALVAGTTAVPVNGDWQYSYRLPTDVVFIRRVVDKARRTYERDPATFRPAIDATGALIYTDRPTSTADPFIVEYTARPAGAVAVSDALFKDALAWRLAWTMAPSLAVKVPEVPESFGRGPDDGRFPKDRPATGSQLRQRAAGVARECYYFALSTAKTSAANEAEPSLINPDADWISGRE